MSAPAVTPAFPGFAPGDARHLLADVHRWARQNGWTWNEAWNWINDLYASDATIGVDWDTDTRTVTVHRNNGNGIFRPTTYPADTVRQAVDVLVTYGVLPARFSSAIEGVIQLCDNYKDQPPPIFRGPGLSERGEGYNAGTRDLAWAVLTVIAGEVPDGGEPR